MKDSKDHWCARSQPQACSARPGAGRARDHPARSLCCQAAGRAWQLAQRPQLHEGSLLARLLAREARREERSPADRGLALAYQSLCVRTRERVASRGMGFLSGRRLGAIFAWRTLHALTVCTYFNPDEYQHRPMVLLGHWSVVHWNHVLLWLLIKRFVAWSRYWQSLEIAHAMVFGCRPAHSFAPVWIEPAFACSCQFIGP